MLKLQLQSFTLQQEFFSNLALRIADQELKQQNLSLRLCCDRQCGTVGITFSGVIKFWKRRQAPAEVYLSHDNEDAQNDTSCKHQQARSLVLQLLTEKELST